MYTITITLSSWAIYNGANGLVPFPPVGRTGTLAAGRQDIKFDETNV
jgi:hypothetical protein